MQTISHKSRGISFNKSADLSFVLPIHMKLRKYYVVTIFRHAEW
jgi:hypothetical protein